MTNEEAIKTLQLVSMQYSVALLTPMRGDGKSFTRAKTYLEITQALEMAMDALKSQIKEPDLEYTRKLVAEIKEEYPDAYKDVDDYIKSLEVNE